MSEPTNYDAIYKQATAAHSTHGGPGLSSRDETQARMEWKLDRILEMLDKLTTRATE